MADEIPGNDPVLATGGPDKTASNEKLEARFLEAEAALLLLERREIGQRYVIKWIAVIVGVSVIIAMAFALVHIVHQISSPSYIQPKSSVVVALIVAPVLSITTLAGALFVAAFGRFRERDLDAVGKGVSGVADRLTGG